MANELKMPHVLVSSIYMILQSSISLGLIFMPINYYIYMGIIIVALAATYIIFMKRNYHLHEEYLNSKLQQS